eukprot:7646986-Alexandrium_andersonii.AAC.1
MLLPRAGAAGAEPMDEDAGSESAGSDSESDTSSSTSGGDTDEDAGGAAVDAAGGEARGAPNARRPVHETVSSKRSRSGAR